MSVENAFGVASMLQHFEVDHCNLISLLLFIIKHLDYVERISWQSTAQEENGANSLLKNQELSRLLAFSNFVVVA